jgi:hypothetical protein
MYPNDIIIAADESGEPIRMGGRVEQYVVMSGDWAEKGEEYAVSIEDSARIDLVREFAELLGVKLARERD